MSYSTPQVQSTTYKKTVFPKKYFLSKSTTQIIRDNTPITTRIKNINKYQLQKTIKTSRNKHSEEPYTNEQQQNKFIFHNSEIIRLMNESKEKEQEQEYFKQKLPDIKSVLQICNLTPIKKDSLLKKIYLNHKLRLKNNELFRIINIIPLSNKDINVNKDNNHSNTNGKGLFEKHDIIVAHKNDYYKPICGIYFKGKNLRTRSLINQRTKSMEKFEQHSFVNEKRNSLPFLHIIK
jgi:hypothetical protein